MSQSGLTIGEQAQAVLLFLLFLIDGYKYEGRHFISMEGRHFYSVQEGRGRQRKAATRLKEFCYPITTQATENHFFSLTKTAR